MTEPIWSWSDRIAYNEERRKRFRELQGGESEEEDEEEAEEEEEEDEEDEEEEDEEEAVEAQELEEALRSFVTKHHKQGNSMLTTTTLPVCAGERRGTVQLKWWKDAGHLLIKTVELSGRGTDPKHAVTAAARAVVEDSAFQALGLRAVCMESVLSKKLLKALAAQGWRLDMYGGNNAWLVARGKCYFCGCEFGEFGNSCEPLASAPWRCCDECNAHHVIFARMRQTM
jgi:hypothetical protein